MSFSPEVLAARRNRINASELGAILGVDDYNTPADVWRDKVKGIVKPPFARLQESAKWGGLLEETLIWAAIEDDSLGQMEFQRVASEAYDGVVFSCTCDAVVFGEDGKPVVLIEAKNRSYNSREKWRKIDSEYTPETANKYIPGSVYAQVMIQMALTGASTARVSVLFGGNEHRVYTVAFMPQVWDEMKEAALDFWKQYIEPEGCTCPDEDFAPPAADVERAAEDYRTLAVSVEDLKAMLSLRTSQMRILEKQLLPTLLGGTQYGLEVKEVASGGRYDYKGLATDLLEGKDFPEGYRTSSKTKYAIQIREDADV